MKGVMRLKRLTMPGRVTRALAIIAAEHLKFWGEECEDRFPRGRMNYRTNWRGSDPMNYGSYELRIL